MQGLRQGDLLSPLLFTLCLEYLSRLIEWVQNKPEFRFHPFCKRVQLSHLCFADDLIMFCRGDRQSVGKVPFRYLGVNITPKRLGVDDCHCLIERISDRIQGLGARKLSYAGRVILIKSVLSTLHNYWARIFILPKSIINRIEVLCMKFLWHGADSRGSPALVAWNQVCQSARKGGLGLKHLHWWNVAAVANWAWKKICWVKEIIKPFLLSQRTGAYTIKQGYQWLVEEGTDKEWHPWMSNSLLIPRHKFNIWLVAHRRLLTMDRLMRMGIVQDNICYLCAAAEESLDHLFFQCPFSGRCVCLMQDWLQIKLPQQGIIEWWIQFRSQSLVMKQEMAMALASLCYQIWISRNKCRVDGLVPIPRVLVHKCKAKIILRLRGRKIRPSNSRVHGWLNMICMG
ncbi:uncharacterized protein LOC141650737 [Silene latifolia]|uniref:uncharacterized protein LOC141650737 n=1 Tax=Silene latifolia TaxID=37657 RepID=UPI003D77FA26